MPRGRTQADAAALLAAVASDRNAPAFARASALTELGSRLSPSNIDLARRALADPDPMVRIGALDMLESVPAAQLWPLVSPLLPIPIAGVRIRAASLLAAVPTASQPPADRDASSARRPSSSPRSASTPIGPKRAPRWDISSRGAACRADAEAEYKAALRLSPQYAPAAINLADLYRQLGRDAEGEGVLRAAIAASPRDAGLHHALGLTLTRLKRPDEALGELAPRRRARA